MLKSSGCSFFLVALVVVSRVGLPTLIRLVVGGLVASVGSAGGLVLGTSVNFACLSFTVSFSGGLVSGVTGVTT